MRLLIVFGILLLSLAIGVYGKFSPLFEKNGHECSTSRVTGTEYCCPKGDPMQMDVGKCICTNSNTACKETPSSTAGSTTTVIETTTTTATPTTTTTTTTPTTTTTKAKVDGTTTSGAISSRTRSTIKLLGVGVLLLAGGALL